MKFDWLTDKVLIAIIGTCSSSAIGLFHLIDAKNRAEVELELRKENDKTINSYALDLADCK